MAFLISTDGVGNLWFSNNQVYERNRIASAGDFYAKHVSGGWKIAPRLLQPRVLCFGLFQNGDIRVGVFPETEEVLVGALGFGSIARE